MPETRQLSERLAVGGQPTVDDLRELRAQGFVAVVNLRTAGEADQPLSPEAEAFAAHEAGLDYRHLPVAIAELGPDHVHRLREVIAAAAGPVYVHCGAGQRACALSLLATSAAPGLSGEELISRAAAAGLPVTDPSLAGFMRAQSRRDGWNLLQAM